MPTAFAQPPGVYLLNHSIGLPLRDARQGLDESFFSVWEHSPADAWPRWLDQIERFRGALASLFRHEAAFFCPQVNVSSALTKILSSLDKPSGRDGLLITEEAFPSLGYVFSKAEAQGYRPRFIDPSASALDVAVWDQALNSDIAFVLITHAHSNTGEQLPVGEILEIARAREIVTVVDVAQSAGVLPIDLNVWDADFVVGTSVKWLCGGPGACFLWVNPDVLGRCEPTDVGWFSHENPFEFDIHEFRYAPDALRFFGGTPSVAPYVLARQGISAIAEHNVATIRAHNNTLCDCLIEATPADWLVSPRDEKRRSGTVVIDPKVDRETVVQRLKAAGVWFDMRDKGLRLSPHVYNSLSDIERVANCF